MEDRMSGFCITKAGGGGISNGGSTPNNCAGTMCGRWNPTTEQVKLLTDLFRSGLRTPSTDEIQNISTQLSFYGKIESKNVFYWFQNHKARERQKRRRLVSNSSIDDHIHNKDVMNIRPDDKFSSARYFTEINHVTEPERVIETLQLFPLNSFDHEADLGKLRLQAKESNEAAPAFSYKFATETDLPRLDLRLSFL